MIDKITENEAAAMLRLHPWQARDLIDEKAIEGVIYVGTQGIPDGDVRVTVASVRAFMRTPRYAAMLAAKDAQDAMYGAALNAAKGL